MSEKSEQFCSSQTRDNLMRAFAGESQAASRYRITAGIAREAGLAVIDGLFRFTAGQEDAHAKLFYRELADLGGQTLEIEGTWPVDLYADLPGYLRAAQHYELQEAEDVYPAFARTAMDEGFPLVSKIFELVARAEKTHGDRFGRIADALEQHWLFSSEDKTKWVCLHCGWSVISSAAPAECPACKHPQGFFHRADLIPFIDN